MLRLLDDKIAVIPIEDPDKVGHLWVPQTAKQRIDQGVIKYIGPNVKTLAVGDYVLFGGYTGTKITLAGEGMLFIMREEDASCLIEGDPQPLLPPREFIRLVVKALGELQQTDGLSDATIRRIGEKIEGHVDDFVRGLEF